MVTRLVTVDVFREFFIRFTIKSLYEWNNIFRREKNRLGEIMIP